MEDTVLIPFCSFSQYDKKYSIGKQYLMFNKLLIVHCNVLSPIGNQQGDAPEVKRFSTASFDVFSCVGARLMET